MWKAETMDFVIIEFSEYCYFWFSLIVVKLFCKEEKTFAVVMLPHSKADLTVQKK